ncbi:MAG TPA: hypothetical protein VE891_05145, partial [Allosphingosinicella sp.]|nr:hypothetical protein [Allosphingosinicella sp.]
MLRGVRGSRKGPIARDAEDLIDRAWEARTTSARVKSARRALAIDPDALDAYVILAQSTEALPEQIALLREAVRIGRVQWAEAIRRPKDHHFWLDIETRPFMRALHDLALTLWAHGEREEAAGLADFMLKLNPNDNQGIRFLALEWHGALKKWGSVERLLKRYRNDERTEYLYAAVLNAFRKGEDADERLAQAAEVNPFVPQLLLGRSAMPEKAGLPYVEFGSREEAAGYARSSFEAWGNVPGALAWLEG